MDILFEIEEQNEFGLMRFAGIVGGIPVGHAWEDMDSENDLGFRLEDWDISGWYPKYYYLKEL